MEQKIPPRPCECGCGEMTKGGFFVSGHDAKLSSAILKHVGGSVMDLRAFVELHSGREVIVGEPPDDPARQMPPGHLPKWQSGILFMICHHIMNGLDDDTIMQEVLFVYPKSGLTREHITTWRSLLPPDDSWKDHETLPC